MTYKKAVLFTDEICKNAGAYALLAFDVYCAQKNIRLTSYIVLDAIMKAQKETRN